MICAPSFRTGCSCYFCGGIERLDGDLNCRVGGPTQSYWMFTNYNISIVASTAVRSLDAVSTTVYTGYNQGRYVITRCRVIYFHCFSFCRHFIYFLITKYRVGFVDDNIIDFCFATKREKHKPHLTMITKDLY